MASRRAGKFRIAGVAALATAGLLFDVALTIPQAPPATAAAARPAAKKRAGLRENIGVLLLVVCFHDVDTA